MALGHPRQLCRRVGTRDRDRRSRACRPMFRSMFINTNRYDKGSPISSMRAGGGGVAAMAAARLGGRSKLVQGAGLQGTRATIVAVGHRPSDQLRIQAGMGAYSLERVSVRVSRFAILYLMLREIQYVSGKKNPGLAVHPPGTARSPRAVHRSGGETTRVLVESPVGERIVDWRRKRTSFDSGSRAWDQVHMSVCHERRQPPGIRGSMHGTILV
jgi:hypothetical protein